MSRLSLFQGYGVELEYMIVDAKTLDVLPIADKLLVDESGRPVSDLAVGPIVWSNELALHLVEIKTAAPVKSFEGLGATFRDSVRKANETLRRHGARLLPTAMHPWMNPRTDLKLWPHEGREIYETFDKVFDCRRHGWANLQSAHLNLPFADDVEFGRLHAAVRLLLPLMPALAASSPLKDGGFSRPLDTRLDVCRANAASFPTVAGTFVPEPVFNESDYEHTIYAPMMAEIAPHDPDGVFEKEFLNSRGAIARFDRGSIEIRVLDVQEHPGVDVAIHAAIVAVIQGLVRDRWASIEAQREFPTERLQAILERVVRDAGWARIDDAEYLQLFNVSPEKIAEVPTASDVWIDLLFDSRFLDHTSPAELRKPIQAILSQGCLAGRIVRKWDRARAWREEAQYAYGALADCLADGEMYGVEPDRMWSP